MWRYLLCGTRGWFVFSTAALGGLLGLSAFRELCWRVDAPAGGAGFVAAGREGGVGAVFDPGHVCAAATGADHVPLADAAISVSRSTL